MFGREQIENDWPALVIPNIQLSLLGINLEKVAQALAFLMATLGPTDHSSPTSSAGQFRFPGLLFPRKTS